jgi:hypothetical protein
LCFFSRFVCSSFVRILRGPVERFPPRVGSYGGLRSSRKVSFKYARVRSVSRETAISNVTIKNCPIIFTVRRKASCVTMHGDDSVCREERRGERLSSVRVWHDVFRRARLPPPFRSREFYFRGASKSFDKKRRARLA